MCSIGSRRMTIEEPEPNTGSEHIIDWLEDSVSFFPSFLDDPYNAGDLNGYQWWDQGPDIGQEHEIDVGAISSLNNIDTTISTSTEPVEHSSVTSQNHHPPTSSSDSSKKRRNTDDNPLPRSSQTHHQRKNQGRRINETEEGVDQEVVVTTKRSVGNKKNTNKSTGNNSNNGNKEGRWAEQLLNPCAVAITAGNLTRVQHLLYVLHELASLTGDANHRLAAHGLRALTHYLASLSTSSSSSSTSTSSISALSFASTEPKFFQKSLLNFYDKSPWFAFPNNIANASILQILAQAKDLNRGLHILDIGVSHGVQWPTLLEALSNRKSGGPPPLIRLTIIAPTIEIDQNTETPFSVGPPGDNFSLQLLGFAKTLNINLQINRLDNHPLQSLSAQTLNISQEETLIVCAQFRLHHLNHNNNNNTTNERTEFLKLLRGLEPKGVILSENNLDCSCNNCGDFATGFSRRVDYLWRFLDSTSSAFKGRESEERRMMEGEAAKAMTNKGEMNEGKEKWCERMREAGFLGEVLGEDAVDGARALLRKYDSNWEMRVEEKDKCVGLWWRGQPVSFCSLWKLDDVKVIDQNIRSTL
ncbi:hypothetical protein LWI29_024053 [Acer saccharum]|uniref:Nodulation signaling pathway 1-like protein n=2 Tax=Acer saccharum TaxID=4024 RepID=A0AA39VSF6_ACESA|nr:hypothetical protein LWI29_024053 [Acer saccharum]